MSLFGLIWELDEFGLGVEVIALVSLSRGSQYMAISLLVQERDVRRFLDDVTADEGLSMDG